MVLVFLLCDYVWCSSVIHRTHCIGLVHLVNLLIVGYHQSSFVSLEIVRLVVLTVLRLVFYRFEWIGQLVVGLLWMRRCVSVLSLGRKEGDFVC